MNWLLCLLNSMKKPSANKRVSYESGGITLQTVSCKFASASSIRTFVKPQPS